MKKQEINTDVLCAIRKPYLDEIAELEKENTELKAELEKWKSEWNEQVIKANDEGYARTLQGIEIEKLKAQIEKMRGDVKDILITNDFYKSPYQNAVDKIKAFTKLSNIWDKEARGK